MIYKLCYVEGHKAWFTSDWKNQYGDDWDDAPYEHNASIPYDCNYNAKSLGTWDGYAHYPKIPQKILYFDLDDYTLPCDNFYPNSPFSVEDINNHRVPWITVNGHYIFAGISYSNFIKQIEELGGTVYLPKNKKEEK